MGPKSSLLKYKQALGPGILFASTAIGVSHLVESTSAGAEYSFGLLWAVLLANIFKYPFFEFGTRYALATGKSLIDGYHSIGKWMFYLYLFLTLSTMFFVAAAVGAVTSGFLDALFGITEKVGAYGSLLTTTALFMVCILILFKGKYTALENLIKILGIVLLVTTITAFGLVLYQGPTGSEVSFISPPLMGEFSALPFLIALMGWMPTAVDLSAWNSLWTLERQKKMDGKISLNASLLDFNLGYFISTLLAVCFLTLGAFLLYHSGEGLPLGKASFANGIIGLYTQVIGEWSYLIIAAAAFSIMFGTCIAVFDGYARTAERIVSIKLNKEMSSAKPYQLCVILTAIGAYLVVFFFSSNLKLLIDLAMILSFVIAPVIAVANLYLVTGDRVLSEYHPPRWLFILAILGILFLGVFTVVFLMQIL
ncbi:MAG: Mn2+/Fe2+ NRAMP family transporter [Flavobacteriales bacterium]|jgi:Mn2+/Fe2+ NRAMP family transporter